ncbi:ABC transporter substrate-binding protein [Naumannella sp. ID2617S]|nr:ABC transporter substrate-binding protein [Naumannella sp. ID2617S]
MSRLIALVTALFSLLVLGGCGTGTAQPAAGGAAAVTVKHAQGSTELKGTPQRVAVLDFGALDTVRALGLTDKVVAVPKQNMPPMYSEFADAKYTDAGTLFEPNLENLNKARPDLVIVGFRSAKQYPELSKHWPTVDITYPGDLDFISGTEKSAGIIGQAFGKQAEVDKRIQELRGSLAAIKPAGAKAGKGLIVMTSAGKVTLHGPKSRFGLVHTQLGIGEAIGSVNADGHGQPASFEAIAQANPDVIFLVDRDAAVGQAGQNARQVIDNELVRGTNAWKNDKVIPLDSTRWYITIHGLDNSKAMLDELAKALSR